MMRTNFHADIDTKDDMYVIQFETSNFKYFKMVEKICQKVINKRDISIHKERCSQASTLGYISK